MKSLFSKIVSGLLSVVLIFGLYNNVFADPEESDTEESTEVSETTVSTEPSDNIITLDNYATAFLNEDIIESPEINGKAYVLFDQQSQTYLYGKDIDVPMEPASTTKLMTVLLALENCKMDDIITITPPMYNGIPDDYVKLGMTEGEEFTVQDLINAAMLKSCNDATLALAIHMAGTEQEFCKMMNARAAELGCTNTNFTSAFGFADPNNLISVSDMCKILEQCITYSAFTEIATSTQYEIASTNKYSDTRVIQNANRFISTQQFSYDYYIGGKTGYTDSAGNTIVAAAKKNDRILIGAIFGAEDSEIRYSDLIKMFDFGFSKFTTVTIDENDYTTIYNDTKNQITELLINTDLQITDYSFNLNEYHTTLTSRALSGYTAVAELSGVIIDPNLTLQSFEIPLYRRYNDGVTYVVGTIHLEIGTKERLIEITPEKAASRNWGRFKKVIITVLGISILAIILIFAMFWFRKKSIQRKDREFRNKSKML